MRTGLLTKVPLGCLLCLLTAILGCCINRGGCYEARYERTDKLQAPLIPGSTLIAETSFGSIKVTGADVTDCNVIATIRVKAPTEEEAAEIGEQVKVQLVPDGNTLTVRADKPRVKKNRSISVSFNITVPRQVNLECSTSYGSINLAHIMGDIKAKTSFASIDSEDIQGQVQLETSYGGITCRDVTSTSLNAKTSFSSINCENVQGPAQLQTSYGSIKCRDLVSDNIIAKSSFGGIDIICSSSSSAEITADVVTSYGSIDFVTPPGFSGQVDLSTSYGSIKTDLPVEVTGEISKEKIQGTIGEGKGKLRLKTSFASIKIR